MTDKFKALESLGQKMEEQAKLKVQLDQSMTLERFESRAFEHGRCTTRVVGNIQHNVGDAKFIVKLGNGEEITHSLMSVPFSLWGAGAQEAYRAIPAHKRKLLDKIIERTAA